MIRLQAATASFRIFPRTMVKFYDRVFILFYKAFLDPRFPAFAANNAYAAATTLFNFQVIPILFIIKLYLLKNLPVPEEVFIITGGVIVLAVSYIRYLYKDRYTRLPIPPGARLAKKEKWFLWLYTLGSIVWLVALSALLRYLSPTTKPGFSLGNKTGLCTTTNRFRK